MEEHRRPTIPAFAPSTRTTVPRKLAGVVSSQVSRNRESRKRKKKYYSYAQFKESFSKLEKAVKKRNKNFKNLSVVIVIPTWIDELGWVVWGN